MQYFVAAVQIGRDGQGLSYHAVPLGEFHQPIDLFGIGLTFDFKNQPYPDETNRCIAIHCQCATGIPDAPGNHSGINDLETHDVPIRYQIS
jgi:hypothetical protein